MKKQQKCRWYKENKETENNKEKEKRQWSRRNKEEKQEDKEWKKVKGIKNKDTEEEAKEEECHSSNRNSDLAGSSQLRLFFTQPNLGFRTECIGTQNLIHDRQETYNCTI